MLEKRNWAIPLILSGILFFILIGWILSTEIFNLSEYTKTIVVYWCLGVSFTSLLCLELFKLETYDSSNSILLEKVLLFPLSILLTSTLIEMGFYPMVIFFVFITSWTVWVVIRKLNRSGELEILNILILTWLVLSVTVSIGQILEYSKIIISKIYALSVFLDLRITLSIIIGCTILIISLGKIDFSSIKTKDILILENDNGNPLLIIVGLFFVLANFLIQIGWWLAKFIYLWGVECVNSIKKKTVETKDSLFDLFIVLFSITGIYITHILSESIVIHYLPINNTIKEIIPFFHIVFFVCLILLIAYLIVRFRHLNWDKWKPVLNRQEFVVADREFRESVAFPILTSGIAGVALFFLSKLLILKLEYFINFGFFSALLSLGLIIAIGIVIVKHTSNSDEQRSTIDK